MKEVLSSVVNKKCNLPYINGHLFFKIPDEKLSYLSLASPDFLLLLLSISVFIDLMVLQSYRGPK